MNGLSLLDMPVGDMLDVIYHLLIEDLVPYTTVQVADDRVEFYHRAKVRADVDDMLDGTSPAGSVGDADPETWGTSLEQQQAMAALMSQLGPPAGGG